jgi:hypothetical protein
VQLDCSIFASGTLRPMTDLVAPAGLPSVANLADFEPLARDRMAGPAFDYVAGGAWDEISLRESIEAWTTYRFVPRVLRDLRAVDLSWSFLGRPAALPVAIAPMAVQGLAHPNGEAEMLAGLPLDDVVDAAGAGCRRRPRC